jgi:hypothetical protein
MSDRPRRFITGFCNPTNPPDSHQRCHGALHGRICACSCHDGPNAKIVTLTPKSSPGLRILPDLVQGSDEWHDQRRGVLTASVIGGLLTATGKVANNDTSRALTALLTAERITGYTDPTYVSDDMLRGIEDEPRAVERYSEHYETPVHNVGFMVRDDWGFAIGYSPDGMVGDDGLLEVKSRRQKKHLQTIVDDAVPAENMAQLQCGLLVSGRKWIDYVSYCGGMPMWVKRVTPDPAWQTALVEAAQQFEQTAAEMVAAYTPATEGLAATERVTEMEMVI